MRPPTPVAVKGYSLTAAPRTITNPLDGVKGASDVFGATTVRSVAQGSTPVGLIFLFAVRPQYLQDTAVPASVVNRLASSVKASGIPLTMQRYGRQRVCAGSSAKNGTIVLWYSKGVLAVVVGGANPALVTDYAKAVVAAG